MTEVSKPLRIAVLVDREEVSSPEVTQPFSLEDYPPLEVEFFPVLPGKPGAPLRPEDFDLVLDGLDLRGRLPEFPGEELPHLVTGPLALVLEELVCQLDVLRQKQEINTGIINSATDAIVTINEDHAIVGYNRGAEVMFGYTREEALGQDLKIIIPPPYKEVHREYLRRFLATREPRVIGKHVRLNAQRRDGGEFPMSISFSVAEIRGNLYFTGIVRDITETRQMEERLLASERLAAIGNTVTHIAHEIKNPLAIIGGFARQLGKAEVLDDKARQKLEIITEEVGRLEAMLAQMRDFMKRPPVQKQVGQIEAVIEETLALFADTFQERHIEERRVEAGPLPPVTFDPQQLSQVLINLFKNALEAMPRGGQLTIATRVQGPNLEISVRDTGEGMAPEVAANIFQPYFTTKEKGTGLGLAICQNIVEEHGGCIFAESAPGKGSTFTIQLPLTEAAPEA
jgi:two-component system sensor kinase FixL